MWHNISEESLSSLSKKKIDTKQLYLLLEKESCLKLMRVYPRLNKFYLYNRDNGIYQEFNSNEMKFLINSLLRELPLETTIGHVTQLLQYFSCGKLCYTGVPQFDRHIIVLQNGTFDFRKGEFRPWSADDFVIGKVQYSYDPEATCPLIRKFLYELSNQNEDRVEFLLCWCWATLRGYTTIQAFLYLTGPGGTGKSVFVHLLSGLVGKHSVITTSLRLLNSDPFEVLNISGKRLISVVDAEFYKGDISVLKALSGGDTLMGRTKFFQGSTEVKAEGLVTIVSNFPLGSLDSSGALIRRMRLFIADKVATNVDTRLMVESSEGYTGKFVSELPGFFNWVNSLSEEQVLTCLSLRHIPSLKEISEHQEYETNPILRWAKEELEVGSGLYLGCKIASGLRGDLEFSLRKPLYPAYERWSRREGTRPLSAKQFSYWILDVLRKAGFTAEKVRRPAGYFISGIGLKDNVFERDYSLGAPIHGTDAQKTILLPNSTQNSSQIEVLESSSPKRETLDRIQSGRPSMLYTNYFHILESNPLKKELNDLTRRMQFNCPELAQEYALSSKMGSKEFIVSLTELLEKGAKRIRSFGLIPTKYQTMGISPRIIPVSYKDSVNSMKKVLRNEGYRQLSVYTLDRYNKVVVDLDLKACYLSILLGLYSRELSTIQSAFESKGLWSFIEHEFISWGCHDLYIKRMVKACVYTALFQGGSTAMRTTILDNLRKDLGLTATQFKATPFYDAFCELAKSITYHMNNSVIVGELRELSSKVLQEHEGCSLKGPTGHEYPISKESFRSSFSNYLQSYEFYLISKTLILSKQQLGDQFEILGHFHDGAVVLSFNDDNLFNTVNSNLNEVRKTIGLSYPIKFEQHLFV